MVPGAREHALHRRPYVRQFDARAAELVVAGVHGGVWWVLEAGSGAAMEAQRGAVARRCVKKRWKSVRSRGGGWAFVFRASVSTTRLNSGFVEFFSTFAGFGLEPRIPEPWYVTDGAREGLGAPPLAACC